MATAPGAIVDWSRSIRSIWAGRLALVALRDGADAQLPEAWRLAIIECARTDWDLRAIAPLERDPLGHRWALVLGRADQHPPPNLALIHGFTPTDALLKGVAALQDDIRVEAE